MNLTTFLEARDVWENSTEQKEEFAAKMADSPPPIDFSDQDEEEETQEPVEIEEEEPPKPKPQPTVEEPAEIFLDTDEPPPLDDPLVPETSSAPPPTLEPSEAVEEEPPLVEKVKPVIEAIATKTLDLFEDEDTPVTTPQVSCDVFASVRFYVL